MVAENLRIPKSIRPTARWLLFLVGNALLAMFALSVLEFLSNPIGLGGIDPPWVPEALLATNTLFDAAPKDVSPSGEFLGYDGFTAEAMNGARGKAKWRYVFANEPSASPLVLSVNPIDRYRWAAAAKSEQNGYCYLILFYADKEHPEKYGGTKYAALPPSAECKGAFATPERVRHEDWPYLPARQEPWATLGLIVAAFSAAAVILSRVFRSRLRKWGRWSIHWAGLILVVAGLWTSSATIA